MMTDVDQECIALCEAINGIKGLRTVESCCGHGEKPFRIWFMVTLLENLPKLLYFIDPCHVELSGQWTCAVTTDCAMSSVTFCLESPGVGQVAYEEALKIASALNSEKEVIP